MSIINGQVASADDVLNAMGSQFKDTAQLIYNTGVAEATLKNVFYQSSLSADVAYGFKSSGGNYITSEYGLLYYAIVEATSYSGSSANVIPISSGKWLIFDNDSSHAQELQRAIVHKVMWSDAEMSKFASPTALKVSDSDDVGFRGYKMLTTKTGASGTMFEGTFTNTSTNVVSSWSNLHIKDNGGGSGSGASYQCPTGTTLNSVSVSNDGEQTINEIGTDKQADEKTNPATFKSVFTNTDGLSTTYCDHEVIFFSKDGMTATTGTLIDFYTDYSVPETTLSGTISAEGADISTLIFKDTATSTVTNTITTWNSTIDAANTLVTSISYDGGSNYETITDATIQRNTNTGTALWLKFELTRTDTSTTDSIEEWATKYNLY